MKKQYTITIEVTSTKPENAAAADALVKEAFEALGKQVVALENTVVVKAAIAEVAPAPPAPTPAPAAPPKV